MIDIGESVVVPEPNESDLHNHSFVGTVIDIDDDAQMVSIEDQDGQIFDIELYRIRLKQ